MCVCVCACTQYVSCRYFQSPLPPRYHLARSLNCWPAAVLQAASGNSMREELARKQHTSSLFVVFIIMNVCMNE